MTVSELISRYNEERTNEIPDDTKLRWLETLERQIMEEVILTHEIPKEWEDFDAETYFDDWGMLKELLVPDMYAEVYTHYLDKKSAWANDDVKRQRVASELFNNAFMTYQKYYNRNNLPAGKQGIYIDHSRY